MDLEKTVSLVFRLEWAPWEGQQAVGGWASKKALGVEVEFNATNFS